MNYEFVFVSLIILVNKLSSNEIQTINDMTMVDFIGVFSIIAINGRK